MKYIADFHIHSHYSRATSEQLVPEYLDYWARLKGITVVGTGDFTHPGLTKERKEKLEPAYRDNFHPLIAFVYLSHNTFLYRKAFYPMTEVHKEYVMTDFHKDDNAMFLSYHTRISFAYKRLMPYPFFHFSHCNEWK